MTLSGDDMSRAYVFLTVPKPQEMDYQGYREMRTAALLAYCHGIKVRFPSADEAIGIASEPYSEKVASQDFLYVDLSYDMSPEEAAVLRGAMEEFDVLQGPAKDVLYYGSHEFPMPFNFRAPNAYTYNSGAPMNRAERRRMAREARKEAKRANRQKF